MTVEHELRLDQPAAHLRDGFCAPREELLQRLRHHREIVTPASRACWRTRATRTTGSLTVNTVLASGTATRPDCTARAT